METILDLYTDYLLASFGQTSATGLSRLVGGEISHDSITRSLSKQNLDSKDLWLAVKPLIREHESEDACIIFDDMIGEKPYTDENDLIAWHYDHSKGRTVKGFNLLSALYHTTVENKDEFLRLPIGFELVRKPVQYCDIETKKETRKSDLTKNDLFRQMIAQIIHNQAKFKYILADSWFGSSENMRFISNKGKFFIFDMKTNRLAALSEDDRKAGRWTRIDELDIPDNTSVKVWLKDLEFPVQMTKQVFKNKDNSIGVRFLVSNDFSLSDDDFTTLYKKRWSIEEYHKSLKQNASISKSPTRTVTTQCNHILASILAYVKLEKMKFANKLNHFQLKAKIYFSATQAALKQLLELKKQIGSA